MAEVIIKEGVKGSWELANFVAAIKNSTMHEKIEIVEFRDGRLEVVFYTNSNNQEGFYIVGNPIITELGSN